MTGLRSDYLGVHHRRYEGIQAGREARWSTPEDVRAMLAQVDRALQLQEAPRSGRLLEVGCGDACLSVALARGSPFCVAGVDIVPLAIELGHQRADRAGVALDLRVGDVRALPWADQYFDIVVDGHCMHCIVLDDRRTFLAEVCRVLRPGGLFVVLTMVGDPPAHLPGTFDPDTRCLVHEGIASRYFGQPESLLDEIATGGLEIVTHRPWPAAASGENDELVLVARKAKQ